MVKRKSSKILPDEYREKAIANDVPIPTVYARLQRGWDLEKAVSSPPKKNARIMEAKRDEGWLVPSERPRLKHSYSTNIPEDIEPLFNEALSESGLTRSEFIAHAIEEYLTKLWKR
ncbi:hypothetical protein WEU38_11005 [Cyanobacterium aponinum AL20118]|uniref:Uncharacterized protein n=1 Tax=Cyanobacterium aponinum AL20115 TaxID=3090662 RepID=A0AAF1C4P6_9CHRO|nr:hypothetical protein [Cyanobacterium aponinum]WPF87340.1 hypothetical protein SAY89_11035 [Cyanobacterium aponinum AL20115]